MKLPHHNRYAFSPLPERKSYAWPNGAKLAVLVVTNIEQFAYRAGLGSDSAQPGAIQNQRNFAWRDYGNRVGIWHLLEMLNELGIPAAHNINSAVLDDCPQIAAALVARGDEFVGHGRTNAERQDILWEEDERRLIVESRDAILRHTGKAPEGWMGPYIAETPVTLDLLKQEGFRYVMDWPADDQPFWMRTSSGPILSVPYSVEINDSPAMVFRHHTGADFEQMIVDQFCSITAENIRWCAASSCTRSSSANPSACAPSAARCAMCWRSVTGFGSHGRANWRAMSRRCRPAPFRTMTLLRACSTLSASI